mmetsp:Transcript_21168/g.66998  ORF Transcript_21168/g.66998 Transcript_21168/m.66998 type:complete len:216 (+) Transcript_21168:2200-2847(+)
MLLAGRGGPEVLPRRSLPCRRAAQPPAESAGVHIHQRRWRRPRPPLLPRPPRRCSLCCLLLLASRQPALQRPRQERPDLATQHADAVGRHEEGNACQHRGEHKERNRHALNDTCYGGRTPSSGRDQEWAPLQCQRQLAEERVCKRCVGASKAVPHFLPLGLQLQRLHGSQSRPGASVVLPQVPTDLLAAARAGELQQGEPQRRAPPGIPRGHELP